MSISYVFATKILPPAIVFLMVLLTYLPIVH
jgi:hypothetical protein